MIFILHIKKKTFLEFFFFHFYLMSNILLFELPISRILGNNFQYNFLNILRLVLPYMKLSTQIFVLCISEYVIEDFILLVCICVVNKLKNPAVCKF